MRDFTFHTYRKLIEALIEQGYAFQTFSEYMENPRVRCVLLRHDSDFWPKNDLKMAKIEHEYGIKSSYYFRVPETSKKEIIQEIITMGHEIGYHYEDLVRYSGNINKALISFKQNLAFLRVFFPVKTIARHGRPLSKIDSLSLWDSVDYKKEFALLGEVYLDINYENILYLTDNGSRWDGHKSNVRDHVKFSNQTLNVRSTFDLICAIELRQTPQVIILNCHPGRWNNNILIWLYRFFIQKIKNRLKIILKILRK